MSSGTWSLSASLLDLTTIQVRHGKPSLVNEGRRLHRRLVHAVALKSGTNLRPGYLNPITGLTPTERKGKDVSSNVKTYDLLERMRPGPASILSKRVEELVNKTSQDVVKSEELEEDGAGVIPFYDEAELRSLYTDLLSHEPGRETERIETGSNYNEVIEETARRLVAQQDPNTSQPSSNVLPTSSLANRLSVRSLRDNEDTQASLTPPPLNSRILHHSILQRITDVANGLDGTRRAIGGSSGNLLVQILSEREWEAITRKCVYDNEFEIAEYVLDLIKTLNRSVPERFVNEVVNAYAKRGDVQSVESLLERGLTSEISQRQRDLHIKAHLNSRSHMYNVYTALATLHNYEALALLPPMKSYARCISALFSMPSAECHAQAWDLFSHMRYVSHAKPDPLLYALMIRACAGTGFSHSVHRSDPVRALDLWTEMTMEACHIPTVGAYNAIILACARSKEYATEAFRLAREMLDSHRDAFGNPLLKPDRKTFAALLTAAKVRGDLRRARWLLAELMSICRKEIEAGQRPSVLLDEDIMMHVFHTYNAYKPPFHRNSTKIVEEDLNAHDSFSYNESSSDNSVGNVSSEKGNFTVTPPQTHSEVIAEVDALWSRILEDKGKSISNETERNIQSGAFSSVHITTKLVNCYLAVHYGHNSIEISQDLFNKVFEESGVERTPRSYVEALERCSVSETSERRASRAFADELWSSWTIVEKSLTCRSGSDARAIERAYTAMIRVLALDGDLRRAMDLLREFSVKYTPLNLVQVTPKNEMRSSRTMLFASRPLVRLTVNSEVPDDTVPPLLTFSDLELLHHKLVSAGPSHSKDIAFVKYICKAYEGSLRKRRDATIRA